MIEERWFVWLCSLDGKDKHTNKKKKRRRSEGEESVAELKEFVF